LEAIGLAIGKPVLGWWFTHHAPIQKKDVVDFELFGSSSTTGYSSIVFDDLVFLFRSEEE
jgi:hypothetical protein